jgi:hypothetical protein
VHGMVGPRSACAMACLRVARAAYAEVRAVGAIVSTTGGKNVPLLANFEDRGVVVGLREGRGRVEHAALLAPVDSVRRVRAHTRVARRVLTGRVDAHVFAIVAISNVDECAVATPNGDGVPLRVGVDAGPASPSSHVARSRETV